MSTTERRQKVVKSHPRLGLVQQCELLGIHRSGHLLKAQKRKCSEPRTYEGNRHIFLGTPLLWSGADDRLPELRPRVEGQCEKGKAALQAHGASDHIQKAKNHHKGRGQLKIPLSAQGPENRAPQSGMAD